MTTNDEAIRALRRSLIAKQAAEADLLTMTPDDLHRAAHPMKHTPGPWHIDPIKARANGNRRIMAEQCTPVAVVPEHLAADARLIAAAPEMLIALECALRAMENQCHRDGIDPQTDTICTIVRNTINKAIKGCL